MFEDLPHGTYYPAVSLYMGARVRMNFGPKFAFPPTDQVYQPFTTATAYNDAQLVLSDLITKVGNEIANTSHTSNPSHILDLQDSHRQVKFE